MRHPTVLGAPAAAFRAGTIEARRNSERISMGPVIAATWQPRKPAALQE